MSPPRVWGFWAGTRLRRGGGTRNGAFGGCDQSPDDPQEREDEADPEHPIVPLSERRQAEVDPARYVHDAQQNPEEGHELHGPFEVVSGSLSWTPACGAYVFRARLSAVGLEWTNERQRRCCARPCSSYRWDENGGSPPLPRGARSPYDWRCYGGRGRPVGSRGGQAPHSADAAGGGREGGRDRAAVHVACSACERGRARRIWQDDAACAVGGG